MLNEVVIFQVHTLQALAAALLLTIGGHRQALNVAGAGDGHNHILFGYQILNLKVFGICGQFGTALVAETLLDFAQLIFDYLAHQGVVGQDLAVVGNALQ